VPEVRRLLKAGADVNAKDFVYGFVLLVATKKGNSQVVKELLDHGADIEVKNELGWTALHNAARSGLLAVVNELLSPSGSNGATASLLGKRKNRGGADTEAFDPMGCTPLHFATSRGHLAIVKALLVVGADILAANDNGELPIHRAVKGRHSAVSKCLLREFYATICGCLPLHKLLEDLT
jgi:ankyrin repeat protein